ncbi:MAG TPA: Uma2 family endonuclease [Isosphaeraceae bacterium]|jgi:Uma2 family endonuclease|nr:Uma2 family endonuclease [Isosphaeraceae bacterium]
MSVETLPSTPEAPGAIALTVPPDQLYRFSVEQYDAMAEHGILTEEDRVELLEGWIISKMGRNPPHILATKLAVKHLARAVPEGWHVAKEDPICTDASEPEPDISVLRGDERDYEDRKPAPEDVGLVVEVADSTLSDDQTYKKQIYAKAGIPFYWIVNIPDTKLLVHGDPTGPGAEPDYRRVVELGPADEVPLVLDGREVGRIAVRDLLP